MEVGEGCDDDRMGHRQPSNSPETQLADNFDHTFEIFPNFDTSKSIRLLPNSLVGVIQRTQLKFLGVSTWLTRTEDRFPIPQKALTVRHYLKVITRPVSSRGNQKDLRTTFIQTNICGLDKYLSKSNSHLVKLELSFSQDFIQRFCRVQL